jgi:hypothetical protein
VVALRARIGNVRAAHLLNLLQKYRVGQNHQTQFFPILALAAKITSSMAARLNS